ncbi:hypothetical protein CYY_003030 [Polysphondylium violaceum]|uniref:Prefoldin beta-like domain containing protein n=1 Tax=Polysphondylium violaceum TaxID=133409 RepID=A0A8J4Q0B5_9MYCE|nr:hypothetical protein CYY_003030 [Polysphondylium violaceum]
MTDIKQLAEQLKKSTAKLQEHEAELNTLSKNRSKLLTQLNENQMVSKEFDLIDENASIYKLNGPVLFKKTKDEAVSNINGRLEIINNNLKQIDAKYKDVEKLSVDERSKVVDLQQKIQALQQKQQ